MRRSNKENFRRTEALLYKYKIINFGIENMENELDEIKRNDGIGSVDPGAECFSTNKISSVTENTAIEKIEGRRVKNLKANIEASKDLIKKIDLVLQQLKENEKEIIRLYYFENIKNDRIVAEKMNYATEWVGRLRRKSVSLISIGLGHSISTECIYRIS